MSAFHPQAMVGFRPIADFRAADHPTTMKPDRVALTGISAFLIAAGCAQPAQQVSRFCDVISRPELAVGDRLYVEAVLIWNENSEAIVSGPECSRFYNADFRMMSVSDERAFMSSLRRTPPTAGQAVQRTRVRIRATVVRLNPNGGVLGVTSAERLD